MRILIVEDSESLQRSISTALRKAGYAVDITGSGSEGLWMATSHLYDVVVLDLMLPGIDGMSVLAKLREAEHDVHVLVLTARDTVADRVNGLRAGADDYLTKPFAINELLARIEALIRRRHRRKSPSIRFGDLEIDTATRTVRRAGVLVDLAPREYSVLHLLALRAGELVTRSEIETSVYDERAEPMSNVVDAAIYALRKKIDRAGESSLIVTRRGMGYILRDAPDHGAATPRPPANSVPEN